MRKKIIVLATPWQSTGSHSGLWGLDGKTIIDLNSIP
jgi:hypothetical protein